jgi:hypothetical protein
VVKEITDQVRQLGPASKLIKELPVLSDESVSSGKMAAGEAG